VKTSIDKMIDHKNTGTDITRFSI